MNEGGRTLLLLDVYALVYRAFFALPPLTSPAGSAVNAAYGFERMLARIIMQERPTHAAACFDAGIPAERLSIAPEYKAHRPEMPDDLSSQFPLVRRLLEAYRIPIVEIPGEEADDCIATLATRASADRLRSVIVSGDLDLLQLVDEHCTVVMPRRGISDMLRYDIAAVKERFGLEPAQLPDYRGLKGDPSDNLPGVPGIGEKTAAKLLAQFGSLDALLANTEAVTPKRVADLLVRYADQARRCRDVSIAKRDLPIALTWPDAEFRGPDADKLNALFRELGFRSLMSQYDERSEKSENNGPKGPSPQGPLLQNTATVATDYRFLQAPQDVIDAIGRARNAGTVALTSLPELVSWRDPSPIAFALAWEPGVAVAFPASSALDEPAVREAFAALLSDPRVGKVAHAGKPLTGWLGSHGLRLNNLIFDAGLAAGLLDFTRSEPAIAETIAALDGAIVHAPFERPTQSLGLFDAGPQVTGAQASAADAILRLYPALEQRLRDAGMDGLMRDVEMPLVEVLAEIEQVGFRLDLAELSRIRANLDRIIAETSAAVYRLAGAEFNINSPKALGEVLFEKLGLPSGYKTKTGYATGIEVLAPLALEHEIAARVLEYREVAKLKSTYVDALPALLDPATGRLHTTLHQLGAATGRLSSSDPNLQNIPIRSAAGREVRRAFLAPTPGNVLLAADYSQIELRLFAHLSGDPNLIAAFAAGEDIHEFAARAVFNVPAEAGVDAEMRRRAKAVNFGILYGQGPTGLAQSVGFSRAEAKDFISAYFARFPRVKTYIDESLERAREQGYVTTLLGRRRLLPDLHSSNHGLRAAAERMAINAPLQGSAADLIKLAMVRIARRFDECKTPARMVLQVHDELIFDVAPASVPEVRDIVRSIMADAIQVSVPLVVDCKVGANWGEVEPA
ncbi:MAG TPA: DNA polymerase I [Candidatus Tumulicola sp.]|nr:DNA polymerase I [Candidatus Tumulicola sp.]